MFTKILLMCIFLITSATKLTCPTTTWTLYKNIEDDATGLYKIEYSDYEVKFTLNRTIIYLCFSNYTVQFKTNWSVNATRTDDYYSNYYYNYQRFVGRVTDNCNKQPARGDHIRLKMKIKEETRYLTWYSWENKELVSEFSYLKKIVTNFIGQIGSRHPLVKHHPLLFVKEHVWIAMVTRWSKYIAMPLVTLWTRMTAITTGAVGLKNLALQQVATL